ncbi:MAG: hypothetical protein A2V70_20890 [Planctomycetes bacterium RBG_13_63_9]|nr:MAG: hypothetical protein A2V70_20890 [Planctomycetes bacterium RBG_13_63_9]
MVRFARFAVLVLVALAMAAPAEANWIAEFAHSIVRDTKRRCCWPKPFNRSDVDSVQAPFALMVANGWRSQNMLAEHHFAAGSGELTEAGRLKVRWIVAEAPQQHRIIYVHRADSFEATAARVDHVQQLAARLVPEGPLPPVIETGAIEPRWSAAEVDIVDRKFLDTIPDPRLRALPTIETGSD